MQGQTINLLEGTALVEPAGLSGSFTTTVAGDVTFQAIGSSCPGTTGTYWLLTVSCSGNSSSMAKEFDNESYSELLTNTQDFGIEERFKV